MSDVKRYEEECARHLPALAEDLDSGYKEFRTEVLVRQKAERAGTDRGDESSRPLDQATRRFNVRVELDETGCYVASEIVVGPMEEPDGASWRAVTSPPPPPNPRVRPGAPAPERG